MNTLKAGVIQHDLKFGSRSFSQRRRLSIAVAAGMLCFAAVLSAQVIPEGTQDQARVEAGAEYSNFSASFPYQSNQRIWGVGAFADVTLNGRLGVEGDVRFLRFGGFAGSTETNYLAGPRYAFRNFGRLRPYLVGLIGVGQIHYPFRIGNANYFAVAPAGGASYRLNRRFALRAEYEYQFWVNSPGYADQPDHPLHPNGFNVGVAYRLSR
jgi:opacity protein-like surface antigen